MAATRTSGPDAGTTGGSVLIVEDEPTQAAIFEGVLAGAGYRTSIVDTARAALDRIDSDPPDIIVLDLHLPDDDGYSVVDHVQQAELPIAIVVATADGSMRVAVEAMRRGAFDFLVKPINPSHLLLAVGNAGKTLNISRQATRRPDRASGDRFELFIGRSPAMQRVYSVIESAAPSTATVFVMGESGTGKEVTAETIHRLSQRRNGPFIAINCAAIPRELMESEIFGHVKGAFTGAVSDRVGAAKAADKGTLFLDEICEMHIDLQSKLLRFLQSGMVQPVGARGSEKVDVRIVCATNRNPADEVGAGRFREDLYYRLHVIPLTLPPLRDRGDDVLHLAEAFLEEFSRVERRAFKGLAPSAQQALRSYPWPGNVRELRNMIHQAVVLNDAEQLEASMLPFARVPMQLRSSAGPAGPSRGPAAFPPAPRGRGADPVLDVSGWTDVQSIPPLAELERAAIERAIELCDGNIPRAAAFLAVSPSTIYRKRASWSAEGDPTQEIDRPARGTGSR